MKVFQIKFRSRFYYGLSAFLLMAVGTLIGFYMARAHADDVYFFILILFGFSGLVFIPNLISTATTVWTINEKEIKIKWLTQFPFHNKPDRTILWESIKEYKLQPYRNTNYFQLKLRDETEIKYVHDEYLDDFDKLTSYFEKQVLEFNEHGINILHPIERAKTIYETKWGLVLAITFFLLLFVASAILISVPADKVDWIRITPGYIGGIYFISKVISYRRKLKRTPKRSL